MERRLLKDFQIGLVEGLMQDAIASSDKSGSAKDVFSKIAKAIGRRTSQGSKKKDWNAVARQRSMVRDPIGSTAEGAERRHRQSVRRYILDHQKDSLLSMDADKLVEYNPRLANITPAARVAYAKFKIPKIKQEYEENTVAGSDDVFESPLAVDVVDETAAAGSSGGKKNGGGNAGTIVRPRPKSTRQPPSSTPSASGALPFPATMATGSQPSQKSAKTSPESKGEPVKSTISKGEPVKPTVSKGEPAKPAVSKGEPATPTTQVEETVAPPPAKPDEPAEPAAKDEIPPPPPSQEQSLGTAVGPPVDGDDGSGGTKTDAETADDGVKAGKHLKPESPKRSVSPRKQGGKSKVTGEILTGWL